MVSIYNKWQDIVLSEDWRPKIGGAHFLLESIYRHWNNDVTVFTEKKLNEKITLEEIELCNGAITVKRELNQVREIGIRTKSVLNLIKNIYILNKAHRGLAVRIHSKAYFPEGLTGLLFKLTRRSPTQVIVYAHGEEINVAKTSRLYLIFLKLVYKSARVVIANSHNTRDMVLKIISNANVVTIHPSIDYNKFRNHSLRREEIRKRMGLAENDFLVLSIGRLEPRKNFHAVYQAISSLRSDGLNIRYILAGAGEQQPKFEQLALNNETSTWFCYMGKITEDKKIDLLSAADLFVMASIQVGPMIEGFGIVFLEAAAAGVPSISGISGGQPEAVIHGYTGLNVDGSEETEIISGIRKFYEDGDYHRKISIQSKMFAFSYDEDEIRKKVEKII